MPVFMLVIAVLIHGIARWRVKAPEQGDEFDNSNVFSWTWFGASIALATLVFITLGMTGFLALQDQPEPVSACSAPNCAAPDTHACSSRYGSWSRRSSEPGWQAWATAVWRHGHGRRWCDAR